MTTLPAAITVPEPMVTPGSTTVPAPIQTSFPMVIGAMISRSPFFSGWKLFWVWKTLRCSRSMGWLVVRRQTFGPSMTLSPMVMGA